MDFETKNMKNKQNRWTLKEKNYKIYIFWKTIFGIFWVAKKWKNRIFKKVKIWSNDNNFSSRHAKNIPFLDQHWCVQYFWRRCGNSYPYPWYTYPSKSSSPFAVRHFWTDLAHAKTQGETPTQPPKTWIIEAKTNTISGTKLKNTNSPSASEPNSDHQRSGTFDKSIWLGAKFGSVIRPECWQIMDRMKHRRDGAVSFPTILHEQN